jgi:hypothetical protein
MPHPEKEYAFEVCNMIFSEYAFLEYLLVWS